jgi:hypothetical protein
MKSFVFIFLVFSILLTGCASSLRKQRKKYRKATSGIKYKSYKSTSKFVVNESLEGYNKQQPDSSLHINTTYAHLLLGYFWCVSDRLSFSFAESNIVEEKSNVDNDSQVRSLAQSLRSITMDHAGWHKLATLESAKSSYKMSADQVSRRKYEAAVYYLLMGSFYVKEKDFEKARPFWNGFTNEISIRWPYQIFDAAAEFQAGNTQQGLDKIKIFSQDTTVPKPVRDVLAIELKKVETDGVSSVNSSLFWYSIIGKMIWQEFKSSSHQSLNKLARSIEENSKKL